MSRTKKEPTPASVTVSDKVREGLIKRFAKDGNINIGTIDTHFSAVTRWLDTGIPELNWAISGSSDKGLPFGRIISFDGPEQSGKTALGYFILGQAAKQGAVPFLIETEAAIDPDFAAKNSLDTTQTIVIGMEKKPVIDDVFAKIAEVINTCAEAGSPAVLVLDSLPACLPNDDDIAKGYEGTRAAQKIRAIFTRFLTTLATNDFMLIIINHLIQDTSSLHPRLIPRGGTGFRHYLSVRVSLDIKEYLRKNKTNRDDYPYGVIVEGLVEKSRFCSPKRRTRFQITFAAGVDIAMSIFHQLKRNGIITTTGAWYEMNGQKFHMADWYDIYNNDPGIKEIAYEQYSEEKESADMANES